MGKDVGSARRDRTVDLNTASVVDSTLHGRIYAIPNFHVSSLDLLEQKLNGGCNGKAASHKYGQGHYCITLG